MPNQNRPVYLFSVMMLCATVATGAPIITQSIGNNTTYLSNAESHSGHNHDLSDDIAALSSQAQRKQDSLDRLTESLSTNISRTSYSSSFSSSSANILAVKPIRGAVITSGYGPRRLFGRSFHKGIDFGAPTGTPIYATGAGIVTYSGWMRGYGNLVEVDHGNGYVTRYGHASRLLVSVGEQIQVNQHIAAVGSTGDSTGSHLHYEVIYQNQHKNPSTYLAMADQDDQDMGSSRSARLSGRAIIERAITPEETQMIQADLR